MPVAGKERYAVFIHSTRTGTALTYIESMLKELSGKHAQLAWSFGVILSDSSMSFRSRIRIDGEVVDNDLFEMCSRNYKLEVKARFSSPDPSTPSVTNSLDAVLVNVALRIFEKLNITTIAICMACPDSEAGTHKVSSESSERNGEVDSGKSVDPQNTGWSVERLVVELYRPNTLICGLEPLPSYIEHLPESWHKSLMYLMRHQAHVISSVQPKQVRMELHSLAKAFGVTIELAQSLDMVPACKDLTLGVFGPEQHHFAALALAACQVWAYRHGLLRIRAQNQSLGMNGMSMVYGLMRTSPKQAPQSPFQVHIQSSLRSTPPWMIRGLCGAQYPGFLYSQPTSEHALANWHYSWAETPDDFSRTGTWFNSVCQKNSLNWRILLIHLPESFIETARYRREADGKWQVADYRKILWSLFLPLRSVSWTCCVFVADIMGESNVIKTNVPPALTQHVLREFWTQLTGLRPDQILIAPSLASAQQLIASKCATHQVISSDGPIAQRRDTDPPRPVSPELGSRSMYFEPSAAQKPPHPLKQSPSSSNIAAPTTRPLRAFSRSAAMKSSTSFENYSESRRKMSFGFGGGIGNASTSSLPLKTLRLNAALPPPPSTSTPSPTHNTDVLVTGSKYFIQATLQALK
ncbi:hypothetical protein H4R20_000698 [Coemansia guatemalensis]|uniref:Uncharacterized protein n=1 Tax=Coemansia guatemalensis TaxID=2761395 RepID=A0A9W8I5S4_9FUNG|nr:hypothetical protein H4R20_000698 [Coemansia guatemalensis]